MKKFKNKNAITLIALVITIVVLLILAGVVLSLVVGEDGITNRAITAAKTQDIADATGLSVRSVNGIVTSAFQRYKDEDKNEIPLMVRVPAEIEDPETGLHKAIKFIQLTDAGRNFVPTVED